jgi:RNA polymerase sigma-70 factor (ECF subfamily)
MATRPGADVPDDAGLAQRARRGDAEAYGELVRRHQQTVFNVCYRLLGHRQEAEDAAQEAFLRAYDRLGMFDLARPFGPWIRRVAANLCLNRLAGQRPPAVELDDERDEVQDPATPGPEAAQEQAERAAAVRAAIAGLPPHYRAVIELRHFQELSYEAIAAALRLPLSDVKSHLFRARRLLAEKLRDSA